MEGTMKAWCTTGVGKLELMEIPIPKCGPHDILFKPSYTSVCGSDLHALYKGMNVTKYPLVMGHEFTGYVVEVGSEVKDIPVGMRFMGTNIQWCGECEHCKSGDVFNCPDVTKYGLGFGHDGCFAEYCLLHNAMLNISVYPLPDNVNDMMGALCEPMCVGAGMADMLDVKDGDHVVIYGAGIIGQGVMQAIKAKAKCEVAIVNRSTFRLDIAKQSGADYVISPTKERPAIEQLREIWGTAEYPYHYGDRANAVNVDFALDSTGNVDIVAECFDIVKANGVVSLLAGYTDEQRAPISPSSIFYKYIKLVPGLAGNFAKSVQYMSDGTFKGEHMVTHVYPFEKIDEAFETARNTRISCKVCVKMDPSYPDYPYNKQD